MKTIVEYTVWTILVVALIVLVLKGTLMDWLDALSIWLGKKLRAHKIAR